MPKSSIVKTYLPEFPFLPRHWHYLLLLPTLSSRAPTIGTGWLCLLGTWDSLLKKVWSSLTVALLLSKMPGGRAEGQTTFRYKAISINDGHKCLSRNIYRTNTAFIWGRQRVLVYRQFCISVAFLPCSWFSFGCLLFCCFCFKYTFWNSSPNLNYMLSRRNFPAIQRAPSQVFPITQIPLFVQETLWNKDPRPKLS